MNKYCFFIAFFLITFGINAQNDRFDEMLDSIQRLRKLSKNKGLEINTRLLHAKKTSELSSKINIDSVSIKSNEALSEIYWNMKLFNKYRDLNIKNLIISKRVNDSSAIGKAYFNLGEFYRKKTHFGDSAYYYYLNAEKVYKNLNRNLNRSETLFGMAVILSNKKDYVRSEKISFEALSLLEKLEETNDVNRIKSFIYNSLGIDFNELGELEKAIKYHKKGLELKRSLKGNYEKNIYNSLNNLAYVYKRLGQYDLASKYLNKILENKSALKVYPKIFVMVLENYAHTLYLSKNLEQIPNLYLKALKIADSVNAEYQSIIIHQHLAEYYHDKNKKDSAKYYAYKAKDISQKYYKDDLLKSLSILSKIEDDSIAVKHYASYIKLNDSIQKNERATRNKFARIQYETDTYIGETKRLTTQNILIVVIAAIVFLVLVLVFIIRVQITKNKILNFESEQQKANEEIYTLMLRQQAKIEEGRLLERHNISEELHDGILNRLLGARLGLEFLSMDEKDKNKENYNFYIKEIQSIEREIRDLSHELKNTRMNPDKDFISILEEYVYKQSNLHTFQYSINQKNKIFWEDINDYTKVNLYRIIQEAIQNIIKHARANTITINFSLDSSDILHVNIIDNGLGFDLNQKNQGIGLLNIESRASKIKGEFKIASEIKNGTTLTLEIPLFKSL